jgi:hypothetical protein
MVQPSEAMLTISAPRETGSTAGCSNGVSGEFLFDLLRQPRVEVGRKPLRQPDAQCRQHEHYRSSSSPFPSRLLVSAGSCCRRDDLV